MFSNPSVNLVILAVIIVVGWFAVGTHFNVRRGNEALKWLQEGLSVVGERTSLRWLGSSAVELKIASAKPPFSRAEVLVVLEPRDVPFLWWFFRIRGRRDLLIVRAQLRSRPGFEMEALDRSSWSCRGIEQQVKTSHWEPVVMPPESRLVAYTQDPERNPLALVQLASAPGMWPERVALRRSEPNLEIHWKLADVERSGSRTVFENLKKMSERV